MNAWLEKNKTGALISVVVLVAAASIVFALRYRAPQEIRIEPPPPTATAGPIRVDVGGAVVNPGVYTLQPGAIVQDAVQAAGGPTADADLSRINLAQPVTGGTKIQVPHVGETLIEPPIDSGEPPSGVLVNINTASKDELISLPQIGPSLAQAIIDYREQYGPFQRIEDIQNVPGIGPGIFEKLKDLITVG